MNTILQSAFLKALGWSLVDSLWQLGIVWLIYMILTGRGRKFTADKRHDLALVLLAAGCTWFLGTLWYRLAVSNEPVNGISIASVTGSVHGFIDPALPVLSVGYLLIAVFLSGRLISQFRLTNRLCSEGLSKAAPELRVFLKQMTMQLSIRREVKIWISSLVETPLTIGFWKPVILLPVAVINNLSVAQTESIILHELNHIRRNDFLVNLVIAIADVFLFFNPFAGFFRQVIHREREHSCDDMVMQFRYTATSYAEALLMLENSRKTRARVALAANGHDRFFLLTRVKRVLTGEMPITPFSQKLTAFFFSTLLLGYIGFSKPGSILQPVIPETPTVIALTPANPAGNETLVSFETRPEKVSPQPVSVASRASTTDQEEEAYFNDHLEESLAKVIVSENIGKLISDASANEPAVEFVKTGEKADYSIRIGKSREAAAVGEEEISTPNYPYVPSYSFNYDAATADSLKKLAVAGKVIEVTRNKINQSIAAVENINWDAVGDRLDNNGEKLNLAKLKVELVKAIAEIDWKDVNREIEASAKNSNAEVLKLRKELATRYEQVAKDRSDRQEAIKAAEEKAAAARAKSAQSRSLKIRKIVSI